MYSVVLSDEFLVDLDELLLYYVSVGGENLADTIYNRIYEGLQSLTTMPKRCPNYPRLPDIRQLTIDKVPYRAYFKIDDRVNEVQVLRILHTSRNHDEIL